jgi:hypothetical protein
MSRRIIKHANRRLYDAQEGRVITLLELSDLLAGGESVVVELKRTGEDITAITLLQSVLERLRRGRASGIGAGARERLLAALRHAMEPAAFVSADPADGALSDSQRGVGDPPSLDGGLGE